MAARWKQKQENTINIDLSWEVLSAGVAGTAQCLLSEASSREIGTKLFVKFLNAKNKVRILAKSQRQ